MKSCSKCKKIKEFKEFHKQKDGFRSHCKSCRLQYFNDNKESLLKRNNELRQKNRDHINRKKKRKIS
jgi:hypothetical protein